MISPTPAPTGFWKRAAQFVSQSAKRLWNGRNSPSLLLRLLWWLSWPGIAVLAFSGSNRLFVLSVFWLCLNVCIAVIGGGWGVFHPRTVVKAVPSIVGLALLMTLLAASLLLAVQDAIAAQLHGLTFSGSALLLIALALFPLTLFLCLFLSGFGASIGAFCTQSEKDYPLHGRWGVVGWWGAFWLAGMLLAQNIPYSIALQALYGAPLAASFAELLALHIYRRRAQPLRFIATFLKRNFRITYRLLPWGSPPRIDVPSRLPEVVHRLLAFLLGKWKALYRPRILDLRGMMLGIIAALVILFSGLMGIFTPIQARLLGVLVEFRSAPLLSQIPRAGLNRLIDEENKRWQTSDMVVVRMDGETRRKILQSGSETATQAAMIRQLKRLGCRYIVLPAPLLYPQMQRSVRATMEAPLVDNVTILRGERDLPVLERAIRETGNVLLSVGNNDHGVEGVLSLLRLSRNGGGLRIGPERSSNREEAADQKQSEEKLRELAKSAFRAGSADLDSLESPRMAAMRAVWSELPLVASSGNLPPMPFVLYALMNGTDLPEKSDQSRALRIHIGNDTLPTTNPGTILVSYFGGEPDTAFLTLNYQTVLSGNPLMPRLENLQRARQESVGIKLDEKNTAERARTSQTKNQTGTVKEQVEWTRLESLIRDKVVLLEGIDLHLHQTPIGTLSEPELLAHATLTLLTRSIVHRLVNVPMLQVILSSLLLAALIGQLSFTRNPFQAGWLAAIIVFLFIIVCLLVFLFARIWIDMIIPFIASAASYLLVVQYGYATGKLEVSRNRELLERVFDKETVDRLLENEVELGGVKKPIVVLFADVRGFSRFASEHTPEVVVATINRYLNAMAEQVEMQDGFIDKFLGDGMLALFGVPKARPDDAIRAVRAAIGMQAEAARISAELIQEGKDPLYLGIGLHYGEAIFGLMGSLHRPDLTAIGHTVVVGQRIQGTALAGEIVLTDEIYDRLSGEVAAEARPPVQVKGLLEPVHSYRLVSDGGGRVITENRQVPEVPPLPAVTD